MDIKTFKEKFPVLETTKINNKYYVFYFHPKMETVPFGYVICAMNVETGDMVEDTVFIGIGELALKKATILKDSKDKLIELIKKHG